LNEQTTIAITIKDKGRLDALKIHDREPYGDVVDRLINFWEKYKGVVDPRNG
jgi:hypothetical protein